MTTTNVFAPDGMTGLTVEPWSKGEVYAVAADWAQASCPVLVYGHDGWTQDDHGRQVADFRHDPRKALESVIREAIEMGGDDPEDDEAESILDDAVELLPESLGEMVRMLESHGDRFAGNCVNDAAQDWLDNGFDADTAGDWCEIGMWDASVAAECRDAGKTPDQIQAAAKSLIDGLDDPTEEYTDGDPIYSACNRDTPVQELIDAVE